MPWPNDPPRSFSRVVPNIEHHDDQNDDQFCWSQIHTHTSNRAMIALANRLKERIENALKIT